MANLTLSKMADELDRIASAQCMSDEAREAAKRAGELLRGFRAALGLYWESEAADLHGLAQNVEPNNYARSHWDIA